MKFNFNEGTGVQSCCQAGGGFSSMALLTPRILSYIMLDKFSDGGVGRWSDNRFLIILLFLTISNVASATQYEDSSE